MTSQHHSGRWGGYELVHWTGHETRLNRPRVTRQDTSRDALAFEELIAEFGAAMLGQHLGFTPSQRADHLGYLAHWADQLRADPRTLWRAASASQQAFDLLTTTDNGMDA